jgi:hypothetical protein
MTDDWKQLYELSDGPDIVKLYAQLKVQIDALLMHSLFLSIS